MYDQDLIGAQLFFGFLPGRSSSFSFALYCMADSAGRVFVGAVGDFGSGKDTAHRPKINAVNTPGVVGRTRRGGASWPWVWASCTRTYWTVYSRGGQGAIWTSYARIYSDMYNRGGGGRKVVENLHG